ncbi:hypothetical protein F4782DRAFT_533530 [Xylaria castorea]|nr:hypothetical protein F4782DRAFT_533530 [Xylaria castorea]
MTVSVGGIAAMSDTKLAQFIVQNRTLEGDFHLPVDDWNKLSEDERNRLAERLNAQNRVLAQSPTALPDHSIQIKSMHAYKKCHPVTIAFHHEIDN